ncbi:MAG: flagellin [Planctomycetota bacterium]
MSRINTNVSSLVAQRVLGQNNQALNVSLERLSTGVAINRGKDNPAGLIASENLRKDLTALNAAVSNSERAERVVNIAEGGLAEVSNLLNELQGLVTLTANDAGLSDAEKEANQLQIDSILQTVDRISGSTSFQGTQLLNGNFDFQVSGQDDGIADLQVNGAKFAGDSLEIDVTVTQSAQRAGVALTLSAGATALALSAPANSLVIELQGSLGTRRFEFSDATSLADAAATINTFSDVTGVSAVASGSVLRAESTSFGADEFVSLSVVEDGGIAASAEIDTFDADNFNALAGSGAAINTLEGGGATRDFGQDIGVSVNGIGAVTSGKTARVDTDFLSVELTVADSDTGTLGLVGTNRSFIITGGGATFQIGSNVDIANQTSIGIADTSTRNLGSNTAGGFLSDLAGGEAANVSDSSGDSNLAQKIVSAAIEQVSSLRGRLGAFQRNTLTSNIQSLGVTIENTAAANSVIRDTDFAAETASLTRSQILAQAATNSLQLANSQPQNALALLG